MRGGTNGRIVTALGHLGLQEVNKVTGNLRTIQELSRLATPDCQTYCTQ
jgi:hypothetical protein